MKNILLIFTIVLISCNLKKDETNSPIFVLEQMKKNIEAGDTKILITHFCEKDAKKIQIGNTVAGVLLGQKGKFISDLIKKKLLESHQINFDNISFENEKITNNTATVESFNSKKEKTKTLHFIKENNIWKMCN